MCIFGTSVIYTCLRSVTERKGFDLIDTIVFLWAPIPANRNPDVAITATV